MRTTTDPGRLRSIKTLPQLIAYVRDRPVADAIQGIQAVLDADLPANQIGPCQGHGAMEFALVSSHLHPADRTVRITHAGAYLPV